MYDMPIRPAFWNIPFWAQVGLYALGFVAVAVCIWGICRCVKLWKEGKVKRLIYIAKERMGIHLAGCIDKIKKIFS